MAEIACSKARSVPSKVFIVSVQYAHKWLLSLNYERPICLHSLQYIQIGLSFPPMHDGVEIAHQRHAIAREEVELGISPPNTELDEGEFEDLEIEHVDVEDFLEDLRD
ncbi:hypothetical protein Tco_0655263 [Tanacetum coccineum]|uniref:Uncharacterized protein n=1 Tax=Tanacetum coccineum TaxID=301880 RepID=A0ABQ4X5I2_9ASTR